MSKPRRRDLTTVDAVFSAEPDRHYKTLRTALQALKRRELTVQWDVRNPNGWRGSRLSWRDLRPSAWSSLARGDVVGATLAACDALRDWLR